MILEILISTMNRKDLSFLDKMFVNNQINDFNILIINQTTKDCILKSDYKNIRVINSFEYGLSKSRNLAIENAIGDICLLADDDVQYVSGFRQIILNSFFNNGKAHIITFKMVDDKGTEFKKYPDVIWHNIKSVITVNSVVIVFKKNEIIEHNLVFNSNFGLGSIFPTGDEYVFLRDGLKLNLNIYFENKVILSHKYFSSGRVMGSDKMVYARSAIMYKYSGFMAYLKLIKYLYQSIMAKEVKVREVIPKYLVGLKGISCYKRILKDS